MNFTRRAFVGSAAAFAAAGCVSSRRCGVRRPAAQLYSLWDYINDRGFEPAFVELGRIGFEGVEFCGYYGKKAVEVRRLLSECGLAAIGSHVSFDDLSPERIGATLDFECAVGNNTVVMGYLKPPKDCADRLGWWRSKADALSAAADVVARRGLRFAYHNHQQELLPMENGQMPLDLLFETFPVHVGMEMDIGHLLAAGASPRHFFGRYGKRAYAIHLTHWELLDGGRLEKYLSAVDPEWLVVESSQTKDRFDSVRRGYESFFSMVGA